MEIRSLRPEELEQAWELDRYSFNAPEKNRRRFLRWDPARLRGAFTDGRLVAMVGTFGFGQFFGGRSVPMGGLSSVAVVPELRGRGLATRVTREALRAMHGRGEVISSLYPATTSLYRGLGWEVAGATVIRRVAPGVLQSLPAPESGRVRPGNLDEIEAFRGCYARIARDVNGFVDRSESWWKVLGDRWLDHRVYVAENDAEEIEGYLVYRQIPGENSALGGPFRLGVMEAMAATRDASLGLWRLLGSWSAQVESIVFRGTSEEPLLLLMPEQFLEVVAEIRWMTRVIDAAGAIEARGFPLGMEIEAHLSLTDAELEANNGPFVLRVSKGRGRLEPGGRGTVGFDIGSFSTLYTGWASTSTLVRSGRLATSGSDDRAALDAAFNGPVPWMLDEF